MPGLKDPRDHGYAWVVLAAAFGYNLLIAIQFAAVGVFLVEFRHYFNTTRTLVAWIGSSTVTVGSFFAFPLSFLVKRLGMRTMGFAGTALFAGGYLLAGVFPSIPMLFVGYGFLPSIGLSLQILVSYVATQKYFNKKRKLACGLMMSGVSCGILIWPIITEALIQAYSWKGAMLILGAVQMNGFVCGALLRPITIPAPRKTSTFRACEAQKGTNMNELTNHDTKVDLIKAPINETLKMDHWAVRWIPFCIFAFSVVLMYAGHQVIHAYIPMRAESLGLTKYQGAFLVSLIGITGLPGRPTCGMIGTHPVITKFSTIMFGMAGVCGGTLNVLVLAFDTYLPLTVLTGLFGIAAAGYVSIQAAIIIDILGVKHAEVGTGVFIFCTALSYLFMHGLSGWMMDYTNNTATPFVVFGAGQILGGVLVACIPLVKYVIRKKYPSTYDSVNEIELPSIQNGNKTQNQS